MKHTVKLPAVEKNKELMSSFPELYLLNVAWLKAKAKQVYDTNETLKTTFTSSSIIAGGCFTSWFHNQTPKDIDVFLLDNVAAQKQLDMILNHKIQKNPDEYQEGDISYLKNKNITRTFLDKKSSIQYIFTNYKAREELVNHFDFLHCCVSYSRWEDLLYVSRATCDAIMNKELRVNNANGIASPIEGWRISKFKMNGWKNCLDSNNDDPFVT